MTVLLAAVLVFWALALGRTIVNLAAVPRLRPDERPPATPFVSVVIPARNEARAIEATLRAFLAQDYPAFEVIVVDDRSTDGTGEIARAIGDPRLRVIDGVEAPEGWLGKPWALQQGSRAARGELLLFADADILYAPAAIRASVAELLRSGVSMIALIPFFEMRGFWENVAMPMLPFTYSAIPVWLANRTRFHWMGMGSGAGNLIRRGALESAGSFESLKDAVVDDIGLSWNVRRAGGTTHAVRAEKLLRVRMYYGAREIVNGFMKNAFFAVGRSFIIGFVVVALLVIGHLLPYVLAFRGNPLALAIVGSITVIRLILFGTMGYRIDNALFLHPLMVLFWLWIFLRSMWFIGIRNEVCWRGRVYQASATHLQTGDIRAAEEKS